MTSFGFAARLEAWLDPVEDHDVVVLDAVDAFVRDVLPPERSAALDLETRTPLEELRACLRGPLGAAMTPKSEGGSLDWATLMRATSRLAAADLGFTLCLGGVVLGAIPLLVAGNDERRRDFFGALRDGGLAGLGLSEWGRGSDLLAIDTFARPLDADDPKSATRFSLRGEKRPINNASLAERLVVLARTGASGDPFGATLFVVPRSSPGLSSGGRVPWIGYAGMDLDAIVLDDVELSEDAVLGKVGEGFALTRRTLETSRGGVATMAAGAGATAWVHALTHVRERALYGAPVIALDAVRAHLADLFTRRALATSVARVAARAQARAGMSARGWTCAAKWLTPTLLERDVHVAGTLLGARSLLRDHPFARLRRDAPVLAIFDGSSQLQQDELWRHALVWPDVAEVTALRGPTPLTAPTDPWAEHTSVSALAPTTLLAEGPWRTVALALREAAGGARRAPQDRRFAVSECAAWLYGLGALTWLAGADTTVVRHARALVATELAGTLAEVLGVDHASRVLPEAAQRGATARALFESLEADGWISG
ncbi:MAG: acyl-CoA dehydrogenase family protein [Sandaracinus sp.]|nr:acyl-CoA dehydrogenase family protein [Sandaracinus sp.]